LRRTGRAGVGVQPEHPPQPGQRIPRGGGAAAHAALRHVAAQPALHGGDPRQTAGRPGRQPEGAAAGGAAPGHGGALLGAGSASHGTRLSAAMNELTRILDAIGQGDRLAAAQLLPLVYDELRKLAAVQLAREKPGQTLDATALVHEAYLRL